MPSTEVNGVSLHIEDRGEGDPVVFIHGSASDAQTWSRQLDAFAQRYRVIAYSRRYHWPNDPIPADADYDMAEHVLDLEALLEHLDAAPADLVGHSYGGFVALLLAMRAPRLVRRLVLLEPPVLTLFVGNEPKPLEILKLLVTRPLTAVAVIQLGAKGFVPAKAAARRNDMDEAMRVFGAAVLGTRSFRRLSAARLAQVRRNLFKAEFLGSGFPPLAPADIRQVQASTLLLTGGHSPAVFHRFTERLQQLLPNAQCKDVPEASHMAHEDNAPAFNAAVLSFLATG